VTHRFGVAHHKVDRELLGTSLANSSATVGFVDAHQCIQPPQGHLMNRRHMLHSLTAALALAGIATGAQAQSTIKVGVLHSLSGTMAISETVLKDVALMAIEEINAAGGVLGKKIEPVVVDPASNWPLFAEKAKQLIDQDKVSVVFGCWTSVSRKSVLPVFEQKNSLLFYPVQYEGEELSKNVFYTGAAPNQQAIPAVEYLMSKDGGSAKRFVLLGTDYVYPRTTNKILRAFLKSKGIADADILEEYTPFGHADYQSIIAKIKKFSGEGKKTAVISTINGDSNVPFYKELGNQGLKATDVPVVAFSVGEEELRGVDTKPLVGHLAAWNYFMSVKNPANDAFVAKWSAYAKAKGIAGHKDKPLTNDPMEATYIGIHMWKQAVEKAKSVDTDKVIAAMAGQTFQAPGGFVSTMDKENHHLHKPVFIGEIKADGQFNIVWKTKGPVQADPWSDYIAENKGKLNVPAVAKK
jgi:urea transport system substrate-binding protein